MKAFTTATREVAREKDLPISGSIEFEFDGRKVTAAAPTGPQLAVFLAAYSDTAAVQNSVTDTITFFDSRFEREDRRYFKRRLNNPDDPFDFEDLADILAFLLEEWSGRPTGSPSDSVPSPTADGTNSTATPQDAAWTLSDSGSTGS